MWKDNSDPPLEQRQMQLKYKLEGLEGIISYLMKNEVSIDDIPEIHNSIMDRLLVEPISFLSKEDKQLIQNEIFTEFSDEEKLEMQKDLALVSKNERPTIISKFLELKRKISSI